ncbi:MAG: class I adenylate-forming enzyme family protein [Burkholderiaceae bacterium]
MRAIDLLDHGLALAPTRPCVIEGERVHTHEQVASLSHRVAAGLRAAGLRRGSRVALYGPNAAQTVVAMVGLLRAGAVWLPVHQRNPLKENLAFLAENACEFIFFHSSVADEVAALRAGLPAVVGAVCLDRALPQAPGFDDWAAGYDEPFPDDEHGPEDLAWIKATGGTTGRPKSVMICHRNAQALFATFHLCMPLQEPHVNLVAAPLTHGAGNIALSILFGGGTLVLLDRVDPVRTLDAIERHRVTTLFLPPTAIYSLLDEPSVRRRDFSSLRYFISAGAPISTEKLAESLEVFGPVMTQAWGQTEAPFICTYLGPGELAVDDAALRARRLRSCGRPSPLTRVAVMDDEGRLLPPNETGELVVRGDLVMKGYFERPDENEKASRFGWHHTGDVGYRDEDGYFYIIDRKKDMIISGGFNIYPSEVEQVLWAHPAILDCAVIGVPDAKWGEALKAVVELKAGAQVAEDELRDYCRAALGGMKTPKSFEVWPTLPRSGLGKVLKREIRERYWQGQERRV